MTQISIRPARSEDLPRITDIYADAVNNGTATYELEAPSLEEMHKRYEALRADEYPYIVAEKDGAVIGYAYAGPFRARPAYRFIVEDSIYIAPEAKGAGVGKALMQALLDECIRLGFRQIVAVIGDGSPTSASVKLHERLGFEHTGAMPGSGYKHGRWLDTVLMQLSMNGGKTLPPDPHSVPERIFQARQRQG
ncbi:GNAT family N-acetyltransferase [Oryzicola mucosus]|uniref:N-acetyltransferase family protein n=1 Tax=Oryzicola mucosus TaxID=2767425 RepID=A0A8J6PTZ3_9HYPH|nr:GNAT family N-acetyltransferase [Oryzicola mucosus]MBD0414083.1 N-acetyltransferase family protein [Oryzicola mucosus]